MRDTTLGVAFAETPGAGTYSRIGLLMKGTRQRPKKGNGKPFMRKPKITVICGGTGIPVILKSLREKMWKSAAIVTVADDGGSSGELQKYAAIDTVR